MADFDLIVIGAGPGGYVAAIRAAQLGMKVACVEKEQTLGGTCLNIGCIPSKALLNSSEKFAEISKHSEEHGITTGKVELDLSKLMQRKNKIVKQLTSGIGFLFKKNKVTHLQGLASFTDKNTIKVSSSEGDKNYSAKNFIIATGSSSIAIDAIPVDEKQIVTSTGALALESVPKSLLVIGGGYIGLEMGSVWSRLGSEVTVIEYLDFITPGMDKEISNEFKKILIKQGIKFKMGSKVNSVKNMSSKVLINYTDIKNSKDETLEVDKVLVSVGRRPYTEGLNLTKVGVKKDNKGRIETNEKLQTSIQNIYAIGDVIKGPMLAHKAEDEGIAVAEILAGQAGHVNYDVIPGVIYTSPEVATVGKTEEQLKKENKDYKVGKFPFLANSRAKVNNETEGFVKILADSKSDKVLGVHIIGPHCGDMIAEMALAMEFGASAEDIARTCHAHPTHTEAIKEAALAVDKRPIHF